MLCSHVTSKDHGVGTESTGSPQTLQCPPRGPLTDAAGLGPAPGAVGLAEPPRRAHQHQRGQAGEGHRRAVGEASVLPPALGWGPWVPTEHSCNTKGTRMWPQTRPGTSHPSQVCHSSVINSGIRALLAAFLVILSFSQRLLINLQLLPRICLVLPPSSLFSPLIARCHFVPWLCVTRKAH